MSNSSAAQWVKTRGRHFVDDHGRQLILRGINLGGDAKVPYPYGGTENPSDFSDHHSVSFVGRPFPEDEADIHLARLRLWGFKILRLVITWEAVEHAGPGQYDLAYIEYLRRLCECAAQHDQAVFIDFHQDVWSRMSGGSGAPGWIFDALGMDLTRFDAADAALTMQQRYDYSSSTAVQNEHYAPMSWPCNYDMAVNGIVWSAFWLGQRLTPAWHVNGENVQRYLQRHFLGAMSAVAERLVDLPNVIGFDSLNEPGTGWIGQRMTESPGEPSPLRAGLRWTAFDALKAASGLSTTLQCTVANAARTQIEKTVEVLINPHAISIWKPGVQCPYAMSGAWSMQGEASVIDADFFRIQNDEVLDVERHGMQPFFRDVATTIRQLRPEWLLFAEINPGATATGRSFPEYMPDNWVNASHWYDVKLLWSKQFKFDLSDTDRESLFQRYCGQLGYLQNLGEHSGHEVPALIGEFGTPYDLDGGEAFCRWAEGERGDRLWASHTLALSLMYDAMDALHLSSTQWNYTASNRNDLRIGDRWNQEDLSIYSEDQRTSDDDPYSGARAAKGFCRPYAQAIQGTLREIRVWTEPAQLKLQYDADALVARPTVIYVPPHYGDAVLPEVTGVQCEILFDAAKRELSLLASSSGRVDLWLCAEARA